MTTLEAGSAPLPSDARPALPSAMRLRLAAMMFLEYAVWGAWMPILSATLFNRGVPGDAIGTIYGALWLACAITPFLSGQLVDRLMPSQRFLGISHLLAAGAAFVLSAQSTTNGYLLWLFL